MERGKSIRRKRNQNKKREPSYLIRREARASIRLDITRHIKLLATVEKLFQSNHDSVSEADWNLYKESLEISEKKIRDFYFDVLIKDTLGQQAYGKQLLGDEDELNEEEKEAVEQFRKKLRKWRRELIRYIDVILSTQLLNSQDVEIEQEFELERTLLELAIKAERTLGDGD